MIVVVPDDRALLAAEFDLLWERDARGRLRRSGGLQHRQAPAFVLAVPADGGALLPAFGHEVPDALADELTALVAKGRVTATRGEPPRVLPACEALLRRLPGAVTTQNGPSYLVEPPLAFESAWDVRRSSDGTVDDLRDAAPEGAGWLPGEWRDLLDGALGPWAMVLEGGRVASVCWSPRLAPAGAEAGTWTAPSSRGRGYAAAATAAWANEFPPGALLFYSTEGANRSSQGVAARLGLREIGWMWQLFVGNEP